MSKTKIDFDNLPTRQAPAVGEKQAQQVKPPVAVGEWLDDFKKSWGDGSRKYMGLETGLAVFDEFVGGLERFVLIAGVAGVGKTALAVQLALGVLRKENLPVIYYTYEMSKDDILCVCLQNIAQGALTRRDILANGNNPTLARDKKLSIMQALDDFKQKYQDQFYLYDASMRAPDLKGLRADIEAVISKHDGKKPLVVLDSVQDLIPRNKSETGAEAETAQELQAIQQSTGATLLGIAQKNKAGWGESDSYGSVLGSVSWIHKPTSVLVITGYLELLKKRLKSTKINEMEKDNTQRMINTLKARKDTEATTLVVTAIKGRNFRSRDGIILDYFGAYKYFEPCVNQSILPSEFNGEV